MRYFLFFIVWMCLLVTSFADVINIYSYSVIITPNQKKIVIDSRFAIITPPAPLHAEWMIPDGSILYVPFYKTYKIPNGSVLVKVLNPEPIPRPLPYPIPPTPVLPSL